MGRKYILSNIQAVLQGKHQQLHVGTFSSKQCIICSGKWKATELVCQEAENKMWQVINALTIMQGENEKQRVRAGERNLPRSESKEQYGFRIASKVIEVEWKDVLHFLAIWVLHIS